MSSNSKMTPTKNAIVENEEEQIQCSTCKLLKPKSDFMKGNRLMKTCSAHRVSRDANSSWAEVVRHIKRAKSKGTAINFKGRLDFSEFATFNAVTEKDDIRTRSRACKKLLADVHRLTGFRFCYRNTWRLEDSWVAKCACAQDTTWDDTKGFRPKDVTKMDASKKVDCQSGLTIRLYYSIRVIELEIQHEMWHEAALEPPPVKGKKGKRPDKIGGAESGDDDDDDDDDEDEEEEEDTKAGIAFFGGASAIASSSASKLAAPKFFPMVASNPNSDSFNHCYSTMQRAQQILDEFKPWMLQGNNFSQFRQFFNGIEQFVSAYDQEKAKTGTVRRF